MHSFTGSKDEVREAVELGLFIGVNGCSFKTNENIETVREIPIENLLLETDAPWSELLFFSENNSLNLCSGVVFVQLTHPFHS